MAKRWYIACNIRYTHACVVPYFVIVPDSNNFMFIISSWCLPGSCRPQMGPMLAPWTFLSGVVSRVFEDPGLYVTMIFSSCFIVNKASESTQANLCKVALNEMGNINWSLITRLHNRARPMCIFHKMYFEKKMWCSFVLMQRLQLGHARVSPWAGQQPCMPLAAYLISRKTC